MGRLAELDRKLQFSTLEMLFAFKASFAYKEFCAYNARAASAAGLEGARRTWRGGPKLAPMPVKSTSRH
jgi:hypothetical protein